MKSGVLRSKNTTILQARCASGLARTFESLTIPTNT